MSLNTTTQAEVEAVREELERLKDGLNTYDSQLTPDDRCGIARAAEAVEVARSALFGAAFSLGRIKRRADA